MDQVNKGKREINPRQHANFLSLITFLFTYKIFRKGFSRDLEEDDVFEILKDYQSNKLGKKLEDAWEKEALKPKPSLLKALFDVFGREYMIYGVVLLIVNTSLMIVKPLALGRLVSYFTPNQTRLTKQDAYFYAGLVVGCTLISTFFLHNYMLCIQQLAMRIKVSFCSLIYRKTLKLSYASLGKVTSGKVVTLITKDVNSFDFATNFAHDIWIGFIQTIVMSYVMYKQIGLSAVLGVGFLILLIPLQVLMGKKTSDYRLKTSSKTDQRVRITQEILTAIKIIKMYTWEKFFSNQVMDVRKREIGYLKIIFYLKATALSIGALSQRLSFFIAIMVYVYYENHITAEKVFVVIGCYASLRSVLTISIPIGMAHVAEAGAALKRIREVLIAEEIKLVHDIPQNSKKINVTATNMSLNLDENDVLKNVNLSLKEGLTIVTGSVGSGKSSLLKMILQDLVPNEGTLEICGVVSFASQEPWLFPASIKQNILFGEPLDEQRYHNVIGVCALVKDFNLLPRGDNTSVTDRGLNLSRGQKARVNLARAIYKKADIYLLDDPLSAVDTFVNTQIFEKCILEFLKNKVCVLVTHQIRLFKDADQLIVLKDGEVNFSGSYQELEKSGFKFDDIFDDKVDDVNSIEISEKVANDDENAKETSKLLDTSKETHTAFFEEKQMGQVEWFVYKNYFKSGGLKMIVLVGIFFVLHQVLGSYIDIFVTQWVDLEQKLTDLNLKNLTNTTEYEALSDARGNITSRYSWIMFSNTAFTILTAFTFMEFASRASITIHKQVLMRVIQATMKFYNNHLTGNVLNRFSKDLAAIDERLPYILFECFRVTLIIIAIVAVISSVNPMFLLPSGIFGVILYITRYLYLRTSRSIKRLESTTRSPVIGHLNATLEGLLTIRASKAQTILKKEFDKHQDLHSSAYYMFLTTSRAFGFFLDLLCAIYICCITFSFLIFKTDAYAGKVGLAISQAFGLTGLLQWGMRQWAELENQMTSVERILEYADIETENIFGEILANWPSAGKIEYNNVCLSYSSNSDYVLKNISFVIEPKMKVGIVGRTGAGKSSIVSVLFRLYDFTGSIVIDGVENRALASDFLRSKIAIIPQDPVLFSGTLRSNMDPNSEYNDEELWKALEEVEIKNVINSLDSGLNTNVNEGGSNFSIGERQLLCLARAIIRKNKILVLDEATANVDPQTDSLIHNTIRKKFVDCTVITIAHRLHTIMESDKILLLDTGSVIEYGEPKILMQNTEGKFYKMVQQAGLLNVNKSEWSQKILP